MSDISKEEKMKLMRLLLVIEGDLECGDTQPLLRLLIKVDKKLLNEFLEEKRERD